MTNCSGIWINSHWPVLANLLTLWCNFAVQGGRRSTLCIWSYFCLAGATLGLFGESCCVTGAAHLRRVGLAELCCYLLTCTSADLDLLICHLRQPRQRPRRIGKTHLIWQNSTPPTDLVQLTSSCHTYVTKLIAHNSCHTTHLPHLSSPTPLLTQLFSLDSSHATFLTWPIAHNFSDTTHLTQTHLTQLISLNSPHTSSRTTHLTQTQLTPLISHNYIAPLISHNSSHETQLNQIIAYNSHKHNSPNSSHTHHLSPFNLYNRHDTNLLLPLVLQSCFPNTYSYTCGVIRSFNYDDYFLKYNVIPFRSILITRIKTAKEVFAHVTETQLLTSPQRRIFHHQCHKIWPAGSSLRNRCQLSCNRHIRKGDLSPWAPQLSKADEVRNSKRDNHLHKNYPAMACHSCNPIRIRIVSRSRHSVCVSHKAVEYPVVLASTNHANVSYYLVLYILPCKSYD